MPAVKLDGIAALGNIPREGREAREAQMSQGEVTKYCSQVKTGSWPQGPYRPLEDVKGLRGPWCALENPQ